MSENAERVFATPAGVSLGTVEAIPEGQARNFVIQLRTGRFHGFVVRSGGQVRGYVDRCPHAGLPLAQKLDAYLSPDGKFIACSWHGALFEIESGKCAGGPCIGSTLTSWPVVVLKGNLLTA